MKQIVNNDVSKDSPRRMQFKQSIYTRSRYDNRFISRMFTPNTQMGVKCPNIWSLSKLEIPLMCVDLLGSYTILEEVGFCNKCNLFTVLLETGA